MRILKFRTTFFIGMLMLCGPVFGQDDAAYTGQVNVITTAVPFLSISPDSRAGGMGDVGAATSPDFNSQAWNPAKYAFLDSDLGVSMSFTPWLRHLVNDINMYYVSGFKRLDKMQTVSGSLRYFSVGTIILRDEDPNSVPVNIKPSEFAIDAAYSRKLSDKFAGSVAFRYIRSDLSANQVKDMEAGNTYASDVSFYFKQPLKKGKLKSDFAAGINISNIGAKISYDGTNKEFIPTNLKLGAAYTKDLDAYNKFSVALDVNKLLVPTPGVNATASTYVDDNKDVSVITGMFKSFGDAPGGFDEELNELMISVGGEYWYANQFAIRAGYFNEHETKGNRKYATAGVGLKFNIFNIDASYIVPVVANNPLANTIRFSLSFNLSEI